MLKNENICTDNQGFFAAANSGRGFISFYKQIFGGEGIERRYLIKGGPGTGKSTLMSRIADRAEALSLSVERYRCSSDPSSLDGIIINKRVAVIDSTAPHAEDAELAGARDIIVDLGRFWSVDGLYSVENEIKELSEKKKRAYALAYRFLSAAMESDIASRELALPYVDNKKIRKVAKRLTRNIESDGAFESKIGLSSAIGMSGRCELNSYASIAKRTVYLEEHYGVGYLVLGEICEEARRKGCKIVISYEPLVPNLPDAVFFEESGVLFALTSKRVRGAVSLRRLLDFSMLSKQKRNELKSKSRSARRISEALIVAATDELKEAGEAHFELEKIYRSNMDFATLDSYTKSLTEQIIEFASRWKK
jgi:hypothetical protein